jgi:hypothetical protein
VAGGTKEVAAGPVSRRTIAKTAPPNANKLYKQRLTTKEIVRDPKITLTADGAKSLKAGGRVLCFTHRNQYVKNGKARHRPKSSIFIEGRRAGRDR